MKKVFFSLFMILIMCMSTFTPTFAATKKANVESAQDPEVHRGPLPSAAPALAPQAQPAAVQTTTLGPNLIQNPSLENGASSTPTSWTSDRWSNNTGAFSYPVTGLNGSKAAQVTITNYTAGDAKWYFADVSVTAGHTYQFSDYSLSNVDTELTARYKMSDGSFTYKYIATVSPSSSFKQNSFQITIPSNVVGMTMFHLIQSVGSLTVDEYSLNEVTTTTEPSPSGNIIANPDLETAGTGGNPLSWNRDRWSNNAGAFNYPVTGLNGTKAAQVTITSYTSGDAKWYFDPVPVSAGNYTYSDYYQSNVNSDLTVQFQNKDGTFSYKGLATLPPAASFTKTSVTISVPSTVAKMTIFHLIQSVGSLTIDSASLIAATSTPSGIFATGGVSLTFDDGWLSQYQNALPKMNAAGIKGTFYIITQQLADNGFDGYVSKAQVTAIKNAGNEIGAHTRTHPHLTTLTTTQQQTEIQGSRQDLINMGVGPITTFSYPYGEYDSSTIQIVKNSGFSSARSTIDGNTTISTDKYQLPRLSVEVNVTPAQVKQWIDTAIANKQWLILTFHRVDTSGEQYSTTPDTFNQIIDYLVQKKAPVVTVSQGVQSLP